MKISLISVYISTSLEKCLFVYEHTEKVWAQHFLKEHYLLRLSIGLFPVHVGSHLTLHHRKNPDIIQNVLKLNIFRKKCSANQL